MHDFCQAKIAEEGVPCFVEQDIGGFDIAMHDLSLMREIQGLRNFQKPTADRIDWKSRGLSIACLHFI